MPPVARRHGGPPAGLSAPMKTRRSGAGGERMAKFDALRRIEPPSSLRYAVAVLSVTVAVIAAWWMDIALQSAAHVSLFLCALMFSAWFGGIGPGLLAVTLS